MITYGLKDFVTVTAAGFKSNYKDASTLIRKYGTHAWEIIQVGEAKHLI